MRVKYFRIVFIFAMIAILGIAVFCFFIDYIYNSFRDEVIVSVGNPVYKEFYTSGGFQDYTDFGIYKFKNVDLSSNKYLAPVTKKDKYELLSYISEFEDCVEAIKRNTPENELVVNYDFDESCISEYDYLYIYDKSDYEETYKEHKYAYFNVYFFDSETQTLYFFHNNI